MFIFCDFFHPFLNSRHFFIFVIFMFRDFGCHFFFFERNLFFVFFVRFFFFARFFVFYYCDGHCN